MDFVNTFDRGMHKDNSPVNQPVGTYRHMVNCSIISQDGNNYAIKDCLGNVKTFTLNLPYSGNVSTFGLPPMPIGFVSFADDLYVFYTNNASTGGYGAIGKLEWLTYGEGVQPVSTAGQQNAGFIPLYHHKDLNFTKLSQIESVPVVENDNTRRIYWTDNRNEPRVINVADPVFTTYIDSGDLVVGQQYMVVEGSIIHDGVGYGPGQTNDPEENVFTATLTTYTSNGVPTPKVIEYVPYELLSWTPDKTLGTMRFKEFGSGNVYCGNKVYFYRLKSNTGYTTPWSYASALVSVGTSNTSAYTPTNDYHDYVGGGAASVPLNSSKSVVITITEVDTRFDVIEMACAEFDQDASSPRQVSIVAVEEITGTSMDLSHTGANYGTTTIVALTAFPAAITKVKTMAANKNYFLIANLTERAEISGTFSATAESFEYPMPALHTLNSDNNLFIYDYVDPEAGGNPASPLVPWGRYVVTSDVGGAVVYDGVSYSQGEVFVANNNDLVATTPGASQIRPCAHRNKYTPIGTSERREDYIEIPEGASAWTYKSPVVSSHCLGYWSNEKYRFGILFYDMKGNPFYVRHLCDYTMPDATTKGGLIFLDDYNGASLYVLNPSGVKFSDINIPKSLEGQISGFSIVRAPRDKRIIAQGLAVQCHHDGASPGVVRPGSWITPTVDVNGMAENTLQFISPDHLTGFVTNFGESGDTIESASWLDAFAFDGSYVCAYGGERQITSKLVTSLTGDTTLRTANVATFLDVEEDEGVSNYDGSGDQFINNMFTETGGATASPDPQYVGGIPYDLNTTAASGCKKAVIVVDEMFLHYSSASTYTDNATGATPRKVLVNYCKPNDNQYGGVGEQAIANTVYISTGHYQALTDTVKSETSNGDYWTFNDVEIFGGDCYLSLVDIGYGLYNESYLAGDTYSYAWSFPCESNVNYELRRGRKTSNVEMFHEGVENPQSIVYLGGGNTRLEDFSYNPGYSADGTGIAYPALPVNFTDANQFSTRIRFAGPKTPGESEDTYREFAALDFKDLDTSGGRINKIAVRDGRVIAWLDKMTSTVPVLERLLLGDTTLGTGGVVDRFDIIKSDFGTQHQWSVVPTEYGFMWFDMRKKAVMIFDSGVGEITQVLGMKSYFDEIFVEAAGNQSASTILNSPTFEETSDRPLTGIGITGVYDPKFKFTYLIFKFHYADASLATRVSRDFTLAYYHPNKCFSHFIDWYPAIAHNHNQIVLAANNPKNRSRYYGAGMSSTAFEVGDTVSYNNSEYICYTAVTIASYPGLAAQIPDAVASAYWTRINSENEIWVNNQPETLGQSTAPDYLSNKQFGKVTTSEVEFVVNPRSEEAITVDCIEMVGNNVYPTDVYVSSATQTASELNIKSWNKYLRFIWDRICMSMPLSSTGRVVGKYVKIRILKKNWTTVPTTVTTSVKTLNYVVSKIRAKR